MPEQARAQSGWTEGPLPENVQIGTGTLITAGHAFKRFRSRLAPGLIIGAECLMDGVHFAIGPQGCVRIGDHCYLTNVTLMCDLELRIGSYVVIGWNASIADSDFHPIEPAQRIADAIACSPLGRGLPRQPVQRRPVTIADDVWIGPNATILKGVTIGQGACIEAGSLVTSDVPPRARVLGNPAQVIGSV